MPEPIIKLENVWKIYQLGRVEVPALKGVSLDINPGSFVTIMGASGSGKSTLLNLIGVLDVPTKGKIFLKGKDISKLSEDAISELRGKTIGFVFQEFNLLHNLIAIENVMLPMIFQGMEPEERKKRAEELLISVGGEMIMIMPGDESNMMMSFIGGGKIEKEDMEAIKRTEGVDKVLPMSYSGVVMRYKEEGKTVLLAGQPWNEAMDILQRFQGWSLSSGRWPISGKNEVIIGQQVASKTFEEKVRVNAEITIKGRKFEVVGILNSLGSKMDDSAVYIDMSIYQNLTGEKKGSAQMAVVKIEEGASANKVAENIKENLKETEKRRAGAAASNFSVITSEKMSGIAGSILGVIQFVIVIFASIAIVVGGIGITNTMFTSVRERTREIGIMKAIGAKNSTVLLIFLIESGIIGFGGGIGGTALGVLFAKIIEKYGQIHPIFYFSASVTPSLILFGLLFSFLVGGLAGFFPARRAAKLKPVEALRRYE